MKVVDDTLRIRSARTVGFYVDEAYTRLALRLWPARWTPEPGAGTGATAARSLADAAH